MISEIEFLRNQANIEGGALSVFYYNIITTLKNCIFFANKAKRGSGFFIFLDNFIQNIIQIKFSQNIA